MTLTYQSAGTAAAASGASPVTIATTVALTTSDALLVVMAYDNSGGSGADPLTNFAVTPAAGALQLQASQTGLNDPGAASAGVAARTTAANVSTAIPSGTNISISWTGTVVVRAIALVKISSNAVGGSVTYRTNSGATGNSFPANAAPGLTTPSVVSGELVLCWAACEWGINLVADADTTNGTWGSIVTTFNGAASIAGISVGVQGKVVTATGSQDFNPTNGGNVTDWILGATIWTEFLPPATFTQAAYRFFADDGTEAASTALAAQNTAYSADIGPGDVTVQVRARVQSTNAGDQVATDDYQLQWEKNASGTWAIVANGMSFFETSGSSLTLGDAGTPEGVGQSFIATLAGPLLKARFNLRKTGAPTGNVIARLYAHTGTFGTNSVGTGAPLAVSAAIPVSSLTTTATWYDFVFDGSFTFAAGTNYVIIAYLDTAGSGANNVSVTAATFNNHQGNGAILDGAGAWLSTSTDICFEVVISHASHPPVGPAGSNFISNNAATTNRLGAGTGSFSAGKVALDGTVEDFTWTANNYTELAYSVTLRRTQLVNGDTIRFRLVRNSSATPFTYTQTPTINVTKSPPAITQASYQIFDDGAETTAPALAAQDTAAIGNLVAGDGIGQLRIRLQSTTAVPIDSTDDFQLQWEKNASGTWTNVTTSDATVAAYNSANLTDAAATTNRLGAGTGSFVAGEISETGDITNLGWAGNNYTELLYAVLIKKASVAHGDVIRFRVLRNGVTTGMTYTQTPRINVVTILGAQVWFANTTQAQTGIQRATGGASGDLKLSGATVNGGWAAKPFSTAAQTVNNGGTDTITSVTGPTNGIEVPSAATEWLSMPLDQNVTIAGAITVTLWQQEANIAANAAVNLILERINSQGAVVSTIAQTTSTTEAGTAAGSVVISVTPTSTNMLKGERIRARVYFDDSSDGSMASGFTLTFLYNITRPSNLQFSEAFGFQTTEPTGAIMYLRSTAGPAVGADDERLLSLSRGASAATAVRNTATGPITANQWTAAAAGTNIEWYSDVLAAVTLDGLVRVNLRAFESGTARCGIRAELAVCNGDGSGAVVWGASTLVDSPIPGGDFGTGTTSLGELTASEAPILGWLSGPSTAIASGKRLRLRVFTDDVVTLNQIAGFTATLAYDGPTAGASGDSWIQLPFSIATDWPATITTSWGTWTATAAGAPDRAATIATSWGTWATTVTASVDHPATVATTWGTWTATGTAVRTTAATVSTSWGTWTTTTTATVERAATVTTSWGTWATTVTAVRTTAATVTTSWGTWAATAIAAPDHPASVATNWGTWTSSAIATPEVSSVIVTTWGTWAATATAVRTTAATATTSWGTWAATATAAPDHPATTITSWGTWAATATGTVSAGITDWPGTISTSWGTWNTTVTAVRTTAATVSTSWGTWSATGTATPDHVATVTTSWGTWTATATAQGIEHPSTIVTNWGSWTTTVTAVRTTAATIATSWGTWTSSALATPEVSSVIITSWGTWVATATAVRDTAATVATSWGTWTATATAVRATAATISTSWGTWASTVTATRETAATATTAWGTWTGTASATPDHPATITSNTGLWTATAVGIVTTGVTDRPATITTSWGTWTATGIATPNHPATITTSWGTWTAIAAATPEVSSVILTSWGTWTATATATRTTAASIATSWGTWVATGTAAPDHVATATTSWGTWTGTATALPNEHPASITSNTGSWAATATGVRTTAASISTAWGTWTATATGVVVAEEIFATITTGWGTWSTTVTAAVTHPATITSAWGTWAATAAATPDHPATVTTSWGTWTATVTAQAIQRNATIATSWGTWNSTTSATVAHPATITTNWGNWTANALGTQLGQAVGLINTNWGTWTATSSALVNHPASVSTTWGTWAATATATRATAASISTTWGNWTATATAQPILHFATIVTSWGNWTASATASILSGALTWVGSTADIGVSGESATFTPGAITWSGSTASAGVAGISGTFTSSGAAWVGSTATVGVSGVSGTFVGGATSWTGSVGDVAVEGVTGVFGAGVLAWIGTTAEIGVAGLSGLFVGGEVVWVGSLAEIGVEGISGLLLGGATVWLGSLGEVGVLAVSGSFGTGIEGQWDGQPFDAMMYGSDQVVEWLLIPA